MTDKISISRIICTDSPDFVEILIEDSHFKTLYKGTMTLGNFTKAITGLSAVKINQEQFVSKK